MRSLIISKSKIFSNGVKHLPKEDSKKEKKEKKEKTAEDESEEQKSSAEEQNVPPEAQNIPPEVLQQLPPEVRSQLGYIEEQQPIFKPANGESKGLSNSIERLREGFEKIGLTLIGRMGEFASTLERVVMTVARIEKVENLTAETTYFLKNLQKTLDGFGRDFKKITDRMDDLTSGFDNVRKEVAELKSGRIAGPPSTPAPRYPATPQVTEQPSETIPSIEPPESHFNKELEMPTASPVEAAPIQTGHSSAEAPTLTAGGTDVNTIFENVQIQIKAGISTATMADILDQAREIISQVCKWTPAVYEIGKLARKLRKDSAVLSENDCIDLSKKVQEWKVQILQA